MYIASSLCYMACTAYAMLRDHSGFYITTSFDFKIMRADPELCWNEVDVFFTNKLFFLYDA